MKKPMSDSTFSKLTLTGCGALILAGILFSNPGPALIAVGILCAMGAAALIGSMAEGIPLRRSPEALAFEAQWHSDQERLDRELEANVKAWKARGESLAEFESDGAEPVINPDRTVH